MDVIDIKRQFDIEEHSQLLIFNPLSYAVEWKFNGVEQVPIPSKENVLLKTSLAKHVGNLLIDLYCSTRDKNYPREKAKKLVFP